MNENKQDFEGEVINQDEVTLLRVAFNNITNSYSIQIPQGSNIAETAFCMATCIKVFIRDGLIENADTILKLIDKYLTDPQFDEVKQDDTTEVSTSEDLGILGE